MNEDPKDALIKEYQDKIKEMSNMLNDPDALRKKLKEMNPNDSDAELEAKLEQYENKVSNMSNSLLDKDKLLADKNNQYNQV